MLFRKYLKHFAIYCNNILDNIYFKLWNKGNKLNYSLIFIDLSLIGDIMVSIPYYYSVLKLLNSKEKIAFLGLHQTKILFECFLKFPNIDFIEISPRHFTYNPLYRWSLLEQLVTSYAIITHPNRTELMEFIALKIKSKFRIAYEGEWIYEKEKRKDKLKYFDWLIKSNTNKVEHISFHLTKLFNTIKKLLTNSVNDFVFITKYDYYRIFTNTKLKNLFVEKKSLIRKKYIVIIPNASSKYRQYPLNNFQKVIDKLPQDIKIIQIGLNKFPLSHPNLIDLTGKTSLEEAMSLVMNASLVIGNETGLAHLAYLSGVPTICILGGGHFGRFLPWPEFDDIVKSVYIPMSCFQCGWKCKYVNLQKGEVPPCIAEIPPKQVIEAVDELNEKYKIF